MSDLTRSYGAPRRPPTDTAYDVRRALLPRLIHGVPAAALAKLKVRRAFGLQTLRLEPEWFAQLVAGDEARP